MKYPVVSLLALAALIAPASAETHRHHHYRHVRGHVVGTRARQNEEGFPITAAGDSIRINAVGEVISQPAPIIEKERKFQDRAKQDLTKPQRQDPQAAPQTNPEIDGR